LTGDPSTVRTAGPEDAARAARLLHDFNTEFDSPTPGVAALTERLGQLIETGAVTVLLAGAGPDGVAVLRLRPALWSEGEDAYLEELYVVPAQRGAGIGRALLDAALDTAREAGAVRIELGTGETDIAARHLYESAGFTNREHRPEGARMMFYEREL
jgi:ribosomal protein S18 acetylase RimI-like enzyme